MTFKKTTLKNGLRVITIPMKGNPTATVLVMVETGSNYESKEQNGLSHFLEHMCFKGTEMRPTSSMIHRELDGLGAQSNAFTSNEFTGYYAKAEKKQWKKLLDILSDMYLHPSFPAEDIEKERGVILQEVSMYEDQPQAHVWDVLAKVLYGDVPAGWPVIGPRENIKRFSRQDFVDYRNAHYVAEKTVVVIAGDLGTAEVKKEVEKFFKNIRRAKRAPKPAVKETQNSPKIFIEHKETDQMHMVLGFHSYKAGDVRNSALSLLSAILGGGFSSRLFEKLRDEMGACYYVRSGNDRSTDHGVFTVATGIDPQRVKEVISVILSELKKFTAELVSEEELARFKDYVSGNLYLGLEGTDDLAEFYAIQEITKGDAASPKELEKKLRAVTAKDIQKVAKDIFKNEKLNLAIVGNIEDEEGIKRVLSF